MCVCVRARVWVCAHVHLCVSTGRSLDLGEQIIPFKSIFAPAGAYTSTKRNFWLPKQLVFVKIEEFERQELNVLNPNL